MKNIMPTAYFYIHKDRTNNGMDDGYAYNAYVCFAEGLSQLGYQCIGSENMYKDYPGADYLIKKVEDFDLNKAEIIFFNGIEIRAYGKSLYKTIQKICEDKGRKYTTVFIDEHDRVRTPGFSRKLKQCDYILKTHFNSKYRYPKNFHPWQFGLSNRIIRATEPRESDSPRAEEVLINFRVHHHLREYMELTAVPIIEKRFAVNRSIQNFDPPEMADAYDLLHWKQTAARHYPQYYKHLLSIFAVAAYGGVFALPFWCNNKYTAKLARLINGCLKIYKFDRVRQWDSWRLWEAWSAACLVFHVDFEKYACVLPVMPINGVHYIGIDPYRLDKLEQILNQPKEELEKIAAQGREFVLSYYTPEAISKRLLALIHSKTPGSSQT